MIDLSTQSGLYDFIHSHKLMNRHSHIEFMANVSIKTSKHEIATGPVKMMARLDGYDNPGTLTFLDYEFDPKLYPSDFAVKWQKFTHVNLEYLLIEGFHKLNAAIGKYEVKVFPLHRTID
ncbi:hypothetical protein [Pseudoflavitalea rhizosphaerae]|uniref:hypothetical protein n=1 Tax=Pseudoflavitalea rhizosphaerae TaxID=1884793 RepID=UPI000F8E4797|nr:hypothetical protein [Pseudoflavitalea rhizosphaerae]